MPRALLVALARLAGGLFAPPAGAVALRPCGGAMWTRQRALDPWYQSSGRAVRAALAASRALAASWRASASWG